jgi:hypothetical protein
LTRPIVLISHLFQLAGATNFKKDYSPPLVRHLDSTTRHNIILMTHIILMTRLGGPRLPPLLKIGSNSFGLLTRRHVLGRWISLKLMWFSNFAFMYNALYYVLGPIGRAPPLTSRGSLQEVVLNWHLHL